MAKSKVRKTKGPKKTMPFCDRLHQEFILGVNTAYDSVRMLIPVAIRNMNINSDFFDSHKAEGDFIYGLLKEIEEGYKNLENDNTSYDTLAGSCARVCDEDEVPYEGFWDSI